MPPTNFFTLNTTDEEDADIDDLESILDDCISLSMPTRYLGWHYRSKHESLIAFSNKNYYDNKLITFPSADDLKSHVKWQKVEGYYDYGKTRTNTAEAEAITDEVINRLRSEPERSLGIVAFSRQQSDLIEDILAEKLSKHPELERQNRQSTEPLFVKNLENVQGDERDVILFSVGYGPDKEGHISMNFGPLNKAGGERRLNVAVSRARYEMKIFSTLTPEQIDERRTQSEGVLGLKRFIQFAQQENTAMDRNRADKESNENLIHQIATCLEKNGYKVNTSVGTSDFRIDIAVIDPLDDEKYILGIICDGERYYRLKTARDREIVQPSVLKRLGWNLMHVWALDWFMHPEMVTKNILERLENIK
jgi:superfamily I DNA and/or RNA helicase